MRRHGLFGAIVGGLLACFAAGLTAHAEELVAATYAVADLVVVPAPKPDRKADPQPLIDHLQRSVAAQSWDGRGGDGTMRFYEQNLALVVRQTRAVHEKLADELNALRRRMDRQVVLELHVISATREDLDRFLPRLRAGLLALRDETVDALFGPHGPALDSQERRCLLDLIAGNPRWSTVLSPKITLFREQVATVSTESWHFVVATKLGADGRTITLRIADHGNDAAQAVARTQVVDMASGTTRLVRFSAESAFPGVIPVAPDAKELLVFVTARTIEGEEEVALGVPQADAATADRVNLRRVKPLPQR
jgi:hypothetical protein